MGTELEMAYFAARKEMPSYAADVRPCTDKNTPNTATLNPMSHLFALLKREMNPFNLMFSLRLDTMFKTTMTTVKGRTAPVRTSETPPERKATAGW